MDKTILIITGPTASGKTDFGIYCARKLNGEIVSCDSMQIYKDLNIGTAKPTQTEQSQIKHYMLDVVNPKEDFSVQQYVLQAEKCIDEIFKKNKLPIIVGGTGLYIRSLIHPYSFCSSNKDDKIREHYNNVLKEKGKEYLYSLLKEKDFEASKKIHMNDTKRIIRALEIFDTTGKSKSQLNGNDEIKQNKFKYILVVLNMDRQKLYEKINKRVDDMLSRGLLDEIKNLVDSKIVDKNCQSMQAIGYKEFFDYFENKITLEQTIDLIKTNSRHYAKRQLTFFRGFDDAVWFDIEKDGKERILKYIEERLGKIQNDNR